METVINFLEQNHQSTVQDVMQTHMRRNKYLSRKVQSRIQGDIRNYLKK